VHKRLKSGLFFIVIVLIILLAIYLKNQMPSTLQITQFNSSQTNAEDIAQKLQSTQLTKKIIIALRAEGYQPDSTIEYLIDSSDNQIITIHLHDLEKLDSRTESKIQKIVTGIAEKNNFNLFIVDVQLTNID
jgi:predicted Zn-dependent protease